MRGRLPRARWRQSRVEPTHFAGTSRHAARHAGRVNGSVQWYVSAVSEALVATVLPCCDAAGLGLAHPATGAVTYLDDRPGREGDQVARARATLLPLSGAGWTPAGRATSSS